MFCLLAVVLLATTMHLETPNPLAPERSNALLSTPAACIDNAPRTNQKRPHRQQSPTSTVITTYGESNNELV